MFIQILVILILSGCTTLDQPKRFSMSPSEALSKATKDDWRQPANRNLVYFYFDKDPVIFELAPDFAPKHVTNIRKIIDSRFWENLYIVRAQDNYVVQWDDPNDLAKHYWDKKKIKIAKKIDGEFEVPLEKLKNLETLSSNDVYAPSVGFFNGLPVGFSKHENRAWLTHCYGMVGVSRSSERDSGNGESIYVVIGHSPRHLDRNITLVGKVLYGMDKLSTIKRGTKALGFYSNKKDYIPIKEVRFANEIPKKQRINLQVLRTDTPLFKDYIEARKNRKESWFFRPAGQVELCNMDVPVRVVK